MLKQNYRLVDSCMTCIFALETSPQDDNTYYHCNFDGKYIQRSFDDYRLNQALFYEDQLWSREHMVEANGICDHFRDE